MQNREYLYGINTILSLLNVNAGKRRIYKIYIIENKFHSDRIKQICLLAKNKDIPAITVGEEFFTGILDQSLFSGSSGESGKSYFKLSEELASSQGIAAEVSGYNYSDFEGDLKSGFSKNGILTVLDGVTDVGNFGSILRNCCAFGISGVIIPADRSVSVNRRVSKISSGATEEIRIYRVINLRRSIDMLKESGFWIYGSVTDSEANVKAVGSIEYNFPVAIVFGGEQNGLSRLVRNNCDFLIKINIEQSIQSLNVSVASGIILYTAYLQKSLKN